MEEVGRRRDPVRETCEIEFRALDRCREKFTSRNQEKWEMGNGRKDKGNGGCKQNYCNR